MTRSAVLGSSAAACSSSSNTEGVFITAIASVRTWRWPPESWPARAARRVSNPRP
jgi:hypothetical protein